MHDWPHAPSHRFESAGTYIVTSGTYRKEPLFRSPERLDFLLKQLFERAVEHGEASSVVSFSESLSLRRSLHGSPNNSAYDSLFALDHGQTDQPSG